MASVRPTLPIPTDEQLGLVAVTVKIPAGGISLMSVIACYRCEYSEAIQSSSWDHTKERLRERGWRLSTTQDIWLCRRCIRKIASITADRIHRAEHDIERRAKEKALTLPTTVVKPLTKKAATRLCEKCKHPMRGYSSGKFYCPEHGWIKV